MTDHPSVPRGTLLGGKFRIDRLLGAGAMGTVYAIDHELTRHKRALKLLHPAVRNIPDIVRRFLNEASAAGRAGNPHLVETFDAGTLPSGEPYVVMELLEGETLGAVLQRERALEPSFGAELVAQAAEGIEAAHRAGIIHRDLKPENLFVMTRDGGPFIKIMDFGVSKFQTGTSSGMRGTQAGMVYGSPAYMSPEQLTGQANVDGRTDVFALGVVLFECLTGTLPFDAPTVEGLMVKVLRGELPPIESLRGVLSPALADVVRRALAPQRDERIASARELAEALAPFRAVPGRHSPDLGFADTMASGPLRLVASHSSSVLSSRPPGVRRAGRTLSLLVIVALVLGAGTTFLVARSRRGAAGSSTVETSTPVQAAAPESAAAPPSPAPVVLATAPAPAESILPPRATEGARHPADLGKAALSPSPAVAPSPPAPARSSAARNLGLREDNPFR
jgi:serine/threonine protein kinase